MKQRTLALVLVLCGLLATSVPVIAADEELSATQPEFVFDPSTIVPGQPRVVVNDQVLNTDVTTRMIGNVTYVPYFPVIKALYPDAVSTWTGERTIIEATGLSMEIIPAQKYVIINGRYLYQPNGFTTVDDRILFPVRTLCSWLGAEVSWDEINYCVVITAGGDPITSGADYYDSTDLYWLSHIINAESGNQPLEGKIAVGNVVLNRVASSTFPNTVKEVIYQKNQFTPVRNGSINLEPNAESVIAAKLCLDGANTVGNALFFLNPRTASNSWASRNRPYITTIGAHAFYG